MRTFFFVAFFALPVAAQWIELPTPGVPRTADGKPNLTAPAPRTATGRPDFSGMWVPRDEFAPGGAGCTNIACAELKLTPQVINIALGMKDGLPYQEWAATLMKKRAQEAAYTDPHTHCHAPNYPRAWALPETQKIFQTPSQLVILHEWNATYRQIFFDGRELPGDMMPNFNGYSVAHWDGDTLAVESAGYKDDSWLDTAGNFFSSKAKVTERIRRPNFGSLDIDLTVDDPTVFTKPWTVALHMKPLIDTEMIDLMCQDNNKDPDHFVK